MTVRSRDKGWHQLATELRSCRPLGASRPQILRAGAPVLGGSSGTRPKILQLAASMTGRASTACSARWTAKDRPTTGVTLPELRRRVNAQPSPS